MIRKKLKIGVLIDQLVPGGVQKDASYEVHFMNRLGHSAQLLVLMRRGFRRKFLSFFPKVSIKFLSDKYPKPFRQSFKFPIFTFFSTLHVISPFFVPKVFKSKEFDIIVAHGTTTCLTALALWKKHRIPYIAIIPDPMEYILKKVYSQTLLKYFFWILSPILFFLEKQIVTNAKAVVVISQKHLPFIQKHYGLNPETLLPGTLPLTRVPDKRQNYLIASSRWESGKNPDLLLELAKRLPKNKIIIAGNWTNETDLKSFREKIEKNNLEKRVSLKLNVKPKELTSLYSQALIYIHPNVESFGLGGFEAASCGCPVIMPAGSGVAQILKDKKAGFFPKKTTVEEFFKPIWFLIKNPQTAKKMGTYAWNTIKKGHSWKNHTRQLEGLIYTALGEINVIALEIGHAQGTVISGGDKLLEEMSNYVSPNISLSVIIPEIAAWHWRNKNAKVITLSKSPLDNNPNPFIVFLNYIARTLATTRLLMKLPAKDIIYSSTNVFPDVVPAFIIRILSPRLKWFARVHHLSPPPNKRPGNWIVNLGSYILQQISLNALRAKSDLVAVLNPNLYQKLLNQNFKKGKLVVVSAGINLKEWQIQNPLNKKLFDAVFLGRFHASKGIYDLIPIWRRVCESIPDAKLALIGQPNPTVTRKILNEARIARIQKNIKILGALPSDKVKEYLSMSKIFLFTDHEAGFGLAPLEAMACGLPVIGYDIGILGKVFKEGYVKVLPFQTDYFAKNVVSLLKDKNKWLKLSSQAITEAQKHDWQKITKNFETLLQAIKTKNSI